MLEAGGVRIDLRSRRVERDGQEVRLTAREFELLAYLVRHPDQVLSREQILNAVWGFDFDPGTKVLEVYIGYLRRKLGAGRRGADRDGAQRRLPTARAPWLAAWCRAASARSSRARSRSSPRSRWRSASSPCTGGPARAYATASTRTSWRRRPSGTSCAPRPRRRRAGDLEQLAQRFVGSRSYHPASRIFVAEVAGGEPVTNQPRILEREEAREHEHEDEDEDGRRARRRPARRPRRPLRRLRRGRRPDAGAHPPDRRRRPGARARSTSPTR